jgi:predicted small lipoprotein YifL
MKIISQLFVIVFAVLVLAACGEQGKGPAQPASSHSSQLSQQ